ncbi:MAG: bifunctional salicylyl-CoA 5-hydroxylase/oxidoreductase [Polyangiaceae bacterium]
MDVVCVGGGPAGLYFAALLKQSHPETRVRVYERNRADDTFGFGVVFSDRTMDNLREADEPSQQAITQSFAHWDDIDIHYRGEVITSVGHGFAGMSRQRLLTILQNRAKELGVEMHFEHDISDVSQFHGADLVIAADGINSQVRSTLAADFAPDIDDRPNRFVWLGTTFPFGAFTFYFKQNEHGLFRVHAYRYAEDSSTFIVECTEAASKAAGFAAFSDEQTIAYMEKLFAEELKGHRLVGNKSVWRHFATVKNGKWWTRLQQDGKPGAHVVLLGDALHTAHFSIGSGTKLALEDAIELHREVAARCFDGGADEDRGGKLSEALSAFEATRKPGVSSIQRAAQVSLEWFENTERYMGLEPLQFAFSLLTRSLRVNHANLQLRDPELTARVDRWVARAASRDAGVSTPEELPPMFTPLKLRELLLPNRIGVSPMCQYSADDGLIGDWHLVHLGSRAIGGAGLLMCEMTAISREARISPGCAGLYTAEHTAAWKRVVDFARANSGAKLGIQLGHAGPKGATDLPWLGEAPLTSGAWPLLAASALPYSPASQTPRAMSRDDMDRTLNDYVAAAKRALEADFDLLEIHLAHGYLLASFVSPLLNRREDAYGGSVEGRMRYPLEVIDAVRDVWPKERPLSVRISACDWHEGGITPDDVVAMGKSLREHGVDIIDVSTGQTVATQRPEYGRLYQTPFSELVRLTSGLPTMAVGNISSFSDANSIIAGGRADVCLLARGHLFDPYWTQHAAQAQGVQLPWPSQYLAVQRFRPRSD